MIVVDTSAVVEFLLGLPRADALRRHLTDDGVTLHAPHLLDVEVTQVLRRLVLGGALPATRGAGALEDLAGLDVARYDQGPLLPRAWTLRDHVTAYDAVYVALAEALDAPLLTLDTKLAATHGLTIRVLTA